MTHGASKRVLVAAGVLAVAAGSAIWLAVTANGVGAALVGSDLSFQPLVGLAIGAAMSQVLFGVFVPTALPSRGVLIRPTGRLVAASTLVGIGLAMPFLTVLLWNTHAHRLGSHGVDLLGEGLVLFAISFATWLVTLVVLKLVVARYSTPGIAQ